MKRSKRERKISKVMGEFKDGTLKSGGSGRKVTNPKQAIAIALSEAKGMNQGGMMYNQIMQRPMFQTPQQRQGMGIMAGVAPVRGYEEGGMAVPEYTPKFLREEQPKEDSMSRMLFEFFVVDPDDPIDVGMATTSAALMAGGVTAPAAIATQLARMGYKGKKLYNLINKVESLGKPSNPDAGVIRQAMAPVGATYGASQTGRVVGEVPEIVEAAGGIGDLVRDSAMKNEAQDYAMGGIAQLSGGGFLESLVALLPKRAQTAGKILERAIDAGEATFDDILNAFRRGEIDEKQLGDLNRRLPEADQGTLVQPGQRLNIQDRTVSKVETDRTGTGVLQDTAKKRGEPKMTEGDIATPPESAIPPPKAPKPPAKVADDAAEAAEEAVKKKDKKKITEKVGDAAQRAKRSKTGQAVSGLLRPITSPIKVGLPLTIGAVGINKLIESGVLDPYINDPRVQQAIQAGKSAYEAVTEFFGPELEALFPDTGERVELTESAQARLPEVEKARKEGFPEPPKDAKKDDGTGTPKPEATGIMKFLFGKDGIGGEPGFAGRLLEKTQDPRLQYQLARAGQATEGRVPRNFYSDFVLAGAEYDELQGKDKTALMQNYEFLKERGKSDDEIFDLLVGKSSQADTLSLFVDLEQEIYDGLLKRPEYLNTEPGADGLTGLQRAARDARIIARQRLSGLAGGQASAPQDSDVTEIPLQPAVQ